MADNKAKVTPRTRVQRFTDEALFIKHFRYVSDLPFDVIQDELEGMAYQPGKLEGVFSPRRRKVTITAVEDNHYTFEIKTKLGGMYTEVRATGHIHTDSVTRETIITGDVKFGGVLFLVLLVGMFFLITWSLTSLSRTGSLPSPFILLTLGLTNLYYFRQMFLDRNDLLKTISQATSRQIDIASARDRLTDKQTDILTTEPDEETNHQQHIAGL